MSHVDHGGHRTAQPTDHPKAQDNGSPQRHHGGLGHEGTSDKDPHHPEDHADDEEVGQDEFRLKTPDKSPQLILPIESVANPLDRDDPPGLRTQLLSQAANMDVHGSGLDLSRPIITPHPLEQKVATQDPTPSLDEGLEELDLLGGKRNPLSAQPNLIAREIHR